MLTFVIKHVFLAMIFYLESARHTICLQKSAFGTGQFIATVQKKAKCTQLCRFTLHVQPEVFIQPLIT